MPAAAAAVTARRAPSPGSARPITAPHPPIATFTNALPAASANASPVARASDPATGNCGATPANITKVIGFTTVSMKVGQNALPAGTAAAGTSERLQHLEEHPRADHDEQQAAPDLYRPLVRGEVRQYECAGRERRDRIEQVRERRAEAGERARREPGPGACAEDQQRDRPDGARHDHAE